MALALLDPIEAAGRWVLWALITALNAVMAALGAVIHTVFLLLPPLPEPLTPPSAGVGQMIAWLLPIGAMIAVLAAAVSAWLSFLVVKIALKWIKAL